MKDRHSEKYFEKYRNKIKEEAIVKYGNKCSCPHCISEKGVRPLILITTQSNSQGQYGIALYLKRIGYKKNEAKLLCIDCYPTCDHSYKKSFKREDKKKTAEIKSNIKKILFDNFIHDDIQEEFIDRIDRVTKEIMKITKGG